MNAFPSRELLTARSYNTWLQDPQTTFFPTTASSSHGFGRTAPAPPAETPDARLNSPYLPPNQGMHCNANISIRSPGAKAEFGSIFHTSSQQSRAPSFRAREYRPIVPFKPPYVPSTIDPSKPRDIIERYSPESTRIGAHSTLRRPGTDGGTDGLIPNRCALRPRPSHAPSKLTAGLRVLGSRWNPEDKTGAPRADFTGCMGRPAPAINPASWDRLRFTF